MSWWQAQEGSEAATRLIASGVGSEWPSPPLIIKLPSSTGVALEKEDQVLTILQEYQEAGAVRELEGWEIPQVKYLIPFFIIEKKEMDGSNKIRLITDCRELNQFLQPKPFKLDQLQQI